MKNFLKLSLFLIPTLLVSQDIAIDTWRSHFNYKSAQIVVRAEQSIFCASQFGLFVVNTESESYQKMSKENGMSDVGITAMHYSEETEILIVGYESGVVDLITSEGEIVGLLTLRDAQVVADKRIHSIASEGAKAFLATDFGVVLLDLANKSINENYRNIGIGGSELKADEVLINGDSLYLISPNGIQAGHLDDNLLDFNEWVFFPETNSGNYANLVVSAGKLYASRAGSELWYFTGSSWVMDPITLPAETKYLFENGELLALTPTEVYKVFPTVQVDVDDDLLIEGNSAIFFNGAYWVADGQSGLLHIGQDTQILTPDGPISDFASRIKNVNGKTFAFFGPNPVNYSGFSDNLGYSFFSNGKWSEETFINFFNITDVAAVGEKLYFSSLDFGVYDYTSQSITNETNSSLSLGNSRHLLLNSIQEFGGSLWLSSYNSTESLYELTVDGMINEFSSSVVGSTFPLELNITESGVIWITRSSSDGGGISTFDPQSNERRIFTTADGLPSSNVSGLSINYEDEVWLSTSSGVGTYSSASYPFNQFGVSIPIFENGFLFENDVINDVLTDGGDRIWFASDRGVWVLAKDLTEVVHHFTIENSPLPSDKILSFAYNKNNGEVFIQTDKGIVSFRSGSSQGDIEHKNKIVVFPNPVRSGYTGTVGITGLVRNAILKITDSKGRLVTELQANGGTASWDLTSFRGGRVQTGIYLIFSSSDDGDETMVGKVAVVK